MNKWTRRAALTGGAAMVTGAGALGYLATRAGGAVAQPGKSRARPVRNDPALPASVDVVVIGGGFVGCATALTLAERGLSVALCEKGVIAGEASGRSVGWVDSQFLDPLKMDLIGRSKELWAGMNDRVGEETGYRRLGLTSLLPDDAAAAAAEDWLRSTRGLRGVNAQLLDSRSAMALQPGSRKIWRGALYQPSDGSVEPTLAAPAMARAARKRGATIHQFCAVRGIEQSGGHVSGVVTEKGAVRCGAAVLAGGYWSPLFAASLGLHLPQFQANASMSRIAGVDGPTISAWGPGFCWRRQLDGSYTASNITGATPITPGLLSAGLQMLPALKHMWGEVEPVFNLGTFIDDWRRPSRWRLDEPSPFEANRILMPEIRNELLDEALATLRAAYPIFDKARTVERWGGVLVTTPDNMPVLSGVDNIPGLFLGTGFYYGLTMGPAAGEALADLVMGNQPQIDLSLYQYRRFGDGSRLVFRS